MSPFYGLFGNVFFHAVIFVCVCVCESLSSFSFVKYVIVVDLRRIQQSHIAVIDTYHKHSSKQIRNGNNQTHNTPNDIYANQLPESQKAKNKKTI